MSGIGVLQIVDGDDLSTVLFDANDPTGVNNPGGLKTLVRDFRLGQVPIEAARHATKTRPGGRTTFSRDDLVEMGWRQGVIEATSFDQIAGDVGVLQRLIRRGGVIKWTPEGSARTRYIDVEPSAPPSLFTDPEDMFRALRSFHYPGGLDVSLLRQPYLREAKLLASANVLTNATLLRDQAGDGIPDGWAWNAGAHTAPTIDAATESYQVTQATSAERFFQQATGAATAAPGDVWSFSGEIAGATDAQGRVQIEYLDAASAVLATHPGILTNLKSAFQRFSVTTPAAPASTDRVRASFCVKHPDATGRVVRLRNAKFEEAATTSAFTVGVETVALDPAATGMSKLLPIYNPSDAPAPVEFVITAPDSGSAITDIIMALRSSEGIVGDRALADLLNGPYKAQAEETDDGWTVALGTNVTAVTIGADASGGGTDAARINHATDPTVYSKKITWTRTTKLDSLRGEHDVWVRCEPQGAEKFFLQLRWGPGNSTPPPYTLDEVTIDASAAAAHDYVMKRLGRIRLPREAGVTFGTLKLELWTHTEIADQDLDVDYLYFVPAERQAHLSAPAGSTVTWLGRELVTPVTNPGGGTAGIDNGDRIDFDTLTDNAGTPPAGGSITEAGRHRVTFRLHTAGTFTPWTMVVRIRNITDSTTTTSKTVTMDPSENPTVTLTFTAVAGKTYQAQVDDPSDVGDASNRPGVISITDTFIPVIGQNEKVRTDPGTVPSRYAVEKLDSASGLVGNLEASAVPFWAPPGLSLVAFEVLDEALTDYEVPQSKNARTIAVAANVTPMRYG